jgi:hypothetical protein
MFSSRDGSFRLFRVAGIDVFLHWSWFVVAFLQLRFGENFFQSQAWNVASYCTLFGIVLLHEFGLWLGLIAAFVALRSGAGFRQAQQVLRLLRLPRHEDAACPACGTSPPAGQFWVCEHCGTRFDAFATRAACLGCGAWFRTTACPYCGRAHPVGEWFAPAEESAQGVEGEAAQGAKP